ncbi:MAG: YkgJ family cysteine cluster protein [Victivallaceae bacterium]
MKHTDEFICKRCGSCCKWTGYVRLEQHEVDAIATFLNMPLHEFIEKYTVVTSDRRGLSLIEREDGSCIFYIATPSACIIDQVKPRQCRAFPLQWNFPGWEKECKAASDIIKR